MYAYFFRRLSKRMKAAAAGTQSGGYPVTESTEYGLRFSFQQLVFQKCATIADTMRLLEVMETNISDTERTPARSWTTS